MIHSLSGGTIKDIGFYNFAKVELETGELKFYIYNISLQVGDEVEVPVGKFNKPTKAKVLELRQNISSRLAPFPIKQMKEIIKKI